jgi:ankyrin repeat protein
MLSPVHVVSQSGNLPFVKLLLRKPNIRLDFTDAAGLTPLHSAARFNHSEICKLLISIEGVKINAQDEDGVCLDGIGHRSTTQHAMHM